MKFITDREQSNVDRLKELSQKTWESMSAAEKAEWSGNPLTALDFNYDKPVNLLPHGPYYSDGVSLVYRNESIVATSKWDGTYIYAVSIIGDAALYEGGTFTLSVEDMLVVGGGKPQLTLYWHDETGYEYAGANLSTNGSITFTVTENVGKRAYLALYVYVTTDASIVAGAKVEYKRIMFESGSVKNEYVPYFEILPTLTTKGAYNYSDLNRVERAVSEISDSVGLGLITKTDWNKWDIPRSTDLERYLTNIMTIKKVLLKDEQRYVLPKSMYKLDFETANTIEMILVAALEHISDSYTTGELYSGEV